jgi:hypothetical protein
MSLFQLQMFKKQNIVTVAQNVMAEVIKSPKLKIRNSLQEGHTYFATN